MGSEREAETERKPCGPNKSLKPADPKDQRVETQDRKRAGRVGMRNPPAKEDRE